MARKKRRIKGRKKESMDRTTKTDKSREGKERKDVREIRSQVRHLAGASGSTKRSSLPCNIFLPDGSFMNQAFILYSRNLHANLNGSAATLPALARSVFLVVLRLNIFPLLLVFITRSVSGHETE